MSAPREPPAPCYENCINSGVSGWDCMSRCNGATDGIDDNTNGVSELHSNVTPLCFRDEWDIY